MTRAVRVLPFCMLSLVPLFASAEESEKRSKYYTRSHVYVRGFYDDTGAYVPPRYYPVRPRDAAESGTAPSEGDRPSARRLGPVRNHQGEQERRTDAGDRTPRLGEISGPLYLVSPDGTVWSNQPTSPGSGYTYLYGYGGSDSLTVPAPIWSGYAPTMGMDVRNGGQIGLNRYGDGSVVDRPVVLQLPEPSGTANMPSLRPLPLGFGAIVDRPVATCRGVVTRVISGSKLAVRVPPNSHEKIRLTGVYTPVPGDRTPALSRWGAECLRFLRRLAEGKEVEIAWDSPPTDRNGWGLAYVYLCDGSGVLLNREVVVQGYGIAARAHPQALIEHPLTAELLECEKEAREQGRGIWATGTP